MDQITITHHHIWLLWTNKQTNERTTTTTTKTPLVLGIELMSSWFTRQSFYWLSHIPKSSVLFVLSKMSDLDKMVFCLLICLLVCLLTVYWAEECSTAASFLSFLLLACLVFTSRSTMAPGHFQFAGVPAPTIKLESCKNLLAFSFFIS